MKLLTKGLWIILRNRLMILERDIVVEFSKSAFWCFEHHKLDAI